MRSDGKAQFSKIICRLLERNVKLLLKVGPLMEWCSLIGFYVDAGFVALNPILIVYEIAELKNLVRCENIYSKSCCNIVCVKIP